LYKIGFKCAPGILSPDVAMLQKLTLSPRVEIK
jgi:hypothetical protein